MSCPTQWRDRDGEHSCRHDANHETRRHTCVCGSWPGVYGATLIDSRASVPGSEPVAHGRGVVTGSV